MNWALRFGFGKGMVLINASLVYLESLSNFHDENLTVFLLIFMAQIRQCFTSGVSQHMKHYSHQVFAVRIQQRRCPIFTAKIRQSFAFGALCYTGRVSCMCIQRAPTFACQDKPQPLKALNILMHVAYTGKPMSLGDIGRDNHTMMIVHTIQHEYAPTAIALAIYLLHKVKSTHDQRGSLMQPQESITQSAQSPTYRCACTHTHTHTHHAQYRKSKSDIAIPRGRSLSKVQERYRIHGEKTLI